MWLARPKAAAPAPWPFGSSVSPNTSMPRRCSVSTARRASTTSRRGRPRRCRTVPRPSARSRRAVWPRPRRVRPRRVEAQRQGGSTDPTAVPPDALARADRRARRKVLDGYVADIVAPVGGEGAKGEAVALRFHGLRRARRRRSARRRARPSPRPAPDRASTPTCPPGSARPRSRVRVILRWCSRSSGNRPTRIAVTASIAASRSSSGPSVWRRRRVGRPTRAARTRRDTRAERPTCRASASSMRIVEASS